MFKWLGRLGLYTLVFISRTLNISSDVIFIHTKYFVLVNIKLKLTSSLEQGYPTLSHVIISTSVAENVVSSGKALATSSLTLWIVSVLVVSLRHTWLLESITRSVQNGAISAVLIGNLCGVVLPNEELKERPPLLFSYIQT